MKHRKMIEAFNLLKEEEGAQFVVREARWRQLVKLVAPDISKSHQELLLRISDDEQKGFVGEQWQGHCCAQGIGEEPRVKSLMFQGFWLVVWNGPRETIRAPLLASHQIP